MAIETPFPFDTKTLPPLTPAKQAKPDAATLFGRSAFKGISATPGLPPAGSFGAENVLGSREAQLNAESVQGMRNEQGTPNPSGFVPHLPTIYGEPEAAQKIGYFAQNRTTQGLPALAPEVPADVAPPPAKPATAEPVAAGAAAKMSNWDIANAFARKQAAANGGAGETYRTSLALALHGLNAETSANAQTTSANAKGGATSGLQDLGVETQYNEIGLPIQTTKRVAQIDPATGTLHEIKLPTIAAKAPLPPKADLKTGQVYPGYGTWTGTGFRPQ